MCPQEATPFSPPCRIKTIRSTKLLTNGLLFLHFLLTPHSSASCPSHFIEGALGKVSIDLPNAKAWGSLQALSFWKSLVHHTMLKHLLHL